MHYGEMKCTKQYAVFSKIYIIGGNVRTIMKHVSNLCYSDIMILLQHNLTRNNYAAKLI